MPARPGLVTTILQAKMRLHLMLVQHFSRLRLIRHRSTLGCSRSEGPMSFVNASRLSPGTICSRGCISLWLTSRLSARAQRLTWASGDDLVVRGSIAKIALILPSFALREAARQAAGVIAAASPQDFFKQLDKAWDKELRRGFRGGSAKEPSLTSQDPAARQDQKSGRLSIDFTAHHDADLANAGFRPRLFVLAVDGSKNDASALCIRDLGFPYIHEAHKAAGDGRPEGASAKPRFGGRKWDASIPGSGQAATARWLAELLALMLGAADQEGARQSDPRRDVSRLSRSCDRIHDRLPDPEGQTLTPKGKIRLSGQGSVRRLRDHPPKVRQGYRARLCRGRSQPARESQTGSGKWAPNS